MFPLRDLTGACAVAIALAGPAFAAAPTAITLAPTNLTASGAHLNGSVDANSAKATVTFEFGPTTSYGTVLDATPARVTGNSPTAVSAGVSGLACGATFHYRVKASNRDGSAAGVDQAFNTLPCSAPSAVPPVAVTGSAGGTSGSAATLGGSATAGSATASLSFDYGSTTAYGSSASATPATLAAGGNTTMSASLSGLACGTTYHFRARAASSAGTGVGANQSFTTAACEPVPPPAPPPSSGIWPWPTWTGQVIAVPPSSTGITYYVDGTAGNDSNTGRLPTAAFRTVAKAASLVAAGDTVLIRKGLYREGIRMISRSGAAGRPITFGSYGDGEVILDGSARVGTWTLVGGTVWQAQASFTPIGVVVNDVPLRQVRQGQGGSTAPQEGLAGVTSGSGKWHRSSANLVTADFGTTLGAGNPNAADIVVPNNNGAQEHVYWWGANHLAFKGLTIRGSGANGLWGYGGNITVEHCNIKFNGKAAVSFLANGAANADNAVINSHAYHNVLLNWPRGNNGYAEAGGSWPGTLAWHFQLRPLARGNVVHMNGGEGVLTYGSNSAAATGSALFEQNVAYDNWSVNLYFDNQPDNVARNNYLFNHPMDPANFLYVADGWPYGNLGKYSVCVMLADEQNSSDGVNGYASLRGTKVYNNIIAGCRIGIRDYGEGTQARANHGLKDTVIANNTIIMAYYPVPNSPTYGILLSDNKTPSGTQRNVNSVIQNNIVYGFNQDAVLYAELPGPQDGLAIDRNLYYSAAPQPFAAGYSTVTWYAFPGWKAASGADPNGRFQDPLLLDLAEFRTAGSAVWDYAKANVAAGSPAIGTGTPQSFPAVNFALQPRAVWNIGAF